MRHLGIRAAAGVSPDTSFASLPSLQRDPRLIRRAPAPVRRRSRIWELGENLHCSIIGTCLSTRELRQVMGRLGIDRDGLTDHELHSEAVRAAGRHDAGAKILNKVLDQRHRIVIRRFDAADGEEALAAQWAEAVRQGDIPGAYWALLTHPSATEALIRRAFGEVHMLSHLVGAANRADIRRLAQLEQELSGLGEKVCRQQLQLREAIVTRDARIEALQRELSERLAGIQTMEATDERVTMLRGCVAALQRRLAAQERRADTARRAQQEARDLLDQERVARMQAEHTAQQLRAELAALEDRLLPDDAAWEPVRHDGLTLLYVGGRTHQVPALRAAAARLGAVLLHHDGGAESTTANFAGLVSQAGMVLFPVDCVSHDAALAVKRLAQRQGKPFRALRSSGAGSLLAALSQPSSPSDSGRHCARRASSPESTA